MVKVTDTNKKYKFDCNNCNKIFSCQLSDITKGVWCSFCVNKTEKILFDKLVKIYKIFLLLLI